jgi:tRNA-dihydrouridine synthase B
VSLKIGNIALNSNIILAPMAGITDLPLRLLAKKHGAGLVYTEMVSARAIFHKDKKTHLLLRSIEAERPLAVQIFGGDPEALGFAAKYVEDAGADIVDINLGCPVKKIAKSGSGVKLLADEKLIATILDAVVGAVKIPVTIKIRIGIFEGRPLAAQIINIAQNCGVKMIALHARYAQNIHAGEPNISDFAEACENAKVPIIANGGIIDEANAKKFMAIPNCKGLMIGRGAIANYSIFARLKTFFDDGIMPQPPTLSEKTNWLYEHGHSAWEHYSNQKGLIKMRKVFPYYLKGFKHASQLKDKFNKIDHIDDFDKAVEELREYVL